VSKARILVIDDDPLIVELIQTTLELQGYPVLVAKNGEQGLQAIRVEHPDLVISDVMMPGVDGFELIRRLRSDPLVKNTPLMILSARGDEEDRIRGLDLGADDYMTKPFAPRELVARVGALVRRLGVMTRRTAPPARGPFTAEGFERLAGHTFDTFVVGRANRAAHDAAKAVAEAPGSEFNPLVLHGGLGLGKTHLLCALGNAVYEESVRNRVLYLTAEVLNQQITDACRAGQEDYLTERYAESDVLLVDDIQFLSISQGLQSVAAAVFSAMYDQGKQVAVSTDSSPSHLLSLSGEISSAFASGFVVEVGRPDADLRAKILRSKAEQAHWPVEGALLDYLANEFATDVRTLEGVAKRLVAMKTIAGVALDRVVVRDVIAQARESAGLGAGPTMPAAAEEAESTAARPATTRPSRPATLARPPARESLLHPARRPLPRAIRELKEEVFAPGFPNPLTDEFSRGLPVTRVVGSPTEVAEAVPESGARPVVVLGLSSVLVVDTVQSLVGDTERRSRPPRGDRWACMAHVTDGEPGWIVIGTNFWNREDEIPRSLESKEPPVFVAVLDSKSPQISEARSLVASIPADCSTVVGVLVGVIIEEKETLAVMLRRLFRVPEGIPVAVGGTIDTPGTRAWVKLAIDRRAAR
jgi:DNA-binding response OmpR family regulator